MVNLQPPDWSKFSPCNNATKCFRLFSAVSRFVSQDLNMRYVAAALLAALGGGEPSAANIKKILR